MSTYQYYEFQAIDRPLTATEMRELRAVSTRAEITPAHFVNEYHWGDFKGSPARWMERYFDAFLYFANWGTRQLMLRLPRSALDAGTAARYCCGHPASAWEAGDSVVLSFHSDDEGDDEYYEAVALLADLRDLCRRDGRGAEAAGRIRSLREEHARKPTLLQRLDLAGLDGSAE